MGSTELNARRNYKGLSQPKTGSRRLSGIGVEFCDVFRETPGPSSGWALRNVNLFDPSAFSPRGTLDAQWQRHAPLPCAPLMACFITTLDSSVPLSGVSFPTQGLHRPEPSVAVCQLNWRRRASCSTARGRLRSHPAHPVLPVSLSS